MKLRDLVFGSLIGVVVLAFTSHGGCEDQKVEATQTAKEWALQLGYNPTHVSCVNHDTDGDGYVSCTVRVKEQPQPIGWECTGWNRYNKGCRTPKASYR